MQTHTPTSSTRDRKAVRRELAADASAPWVLVAGGFHRNGGMDKANLALAQYLIEQGTPVQIVCHLVTSDLKLDARATVHVVPRPAGSYLLGRPLLDLRGRAVARQVTGRWPSAPVVINGGNCAWPGIDWVHYVNHAPKPKRVNAPFWFRTKDRLSQWQGLHNEKTAARRSRLFIANSAKTKQDLVQYVGVDPRQIEVVYLGAESDWRPATPEERSKGKQSFGVSPGRHVAAFIGSLSLDHNKGFDTLLAAWKQLCGDPAWDVDLLVAGGGNGLGMWRAEISRLGLENRIRMLGFVNRVSDFLAAADVLVSPVRYESYGLNVQEAVCRGVPAIVSANAGVAERYGQDLFALLLPDPEDVGDLVARLKQWRNESGLWRGRFEPLGESLRSYGWNDMARQIVSLVMRHQESRSTR